MRHKIKVELLENLTLLPDDVFGDGPPEAWSKGGKVQEFINFSYTGSFSIQGDILKNNIVVEKQTKKGITISGNFTALLFELKPEKEESFKNDLVDDEWTDYGKINMFYFKMEKSDDSVTFSENGEGHLSKEFGKKHKLSLLETVD
jgi:hypothetical protein